MSRATMRLRKVFMAALLVVSASAHAADGLPEPSIAISGHVQHPQNLALSDLQKFPATTVQASFLTDQGTMTGNYTGALLWAVLGNAGVVDDAGKNAYLRHTYVVTGRDGYAVALSQGELDPRYEGKSAILAFAKDGKPLEAGDAIRLIVPGDHHGGRQVRDVVSVGVR